MFDYLKLASGSFPTLCVLFVLTSSMACQDEGVRDLPGDPGDTDTLQVDPNENNLVEGVDYFLPKIDLTNWKVTLPIPNESGRPIEVHPPEISSYANNEILKPFMFNDSTDGSLVFYTYPGSSTANSSYSRTELREQMVPGSNSTNWTFGQGGFMRGTLAVPEISTGSNGNAHLTMVMQIHGRLTNEQRDLIREDDNNAPPILKIYWHEGLIRVVTKKLKDENATYEESLHSSAWTDDERRYFQREVGTDKFTLEVVASEGKIEVTMDDDEKFVFESPSLDRWNVFENYFKAGNYLVTTDENAFAKVKYYDLVVSHD